MINTIEIRREAISMEMSAIIKNEFFY